MDQDDIINSILKENTPVGFEYNEKKYDLNDIINENTSNYLPKDEVKETQKEPQETISKEEPKYNDKDKNIEDEIISNILTETEKESKINIHTEVNKYTDNIEDEIINKILSETSKEPVQETPKEEALTEKDIISKEPLKEPKKIQEKIISIEAKQESTEKPSQITSGETKQETQNETEKEIPKEKEIKKEVKRYIPKVSEEIIKKELEKKNEITKKEKDEQLKRDLEKIIEEENKKKELEQKEIMRKKNEEKKKKIDDLYPPYKNPLDFIQYLEVDRINGQISKEIENFILQNHRKQDNKYELSEKVSLNKISGQLSAFNIACILAKNNNLIVSTVDGIIFFYSLKDEKLIKKIFPKNLNNIYMNCLDITNDFSEMICGYQDGTIAMISFTKEEVKYTNNKIHKDCSCLELKIFKKEKNDIYFVSTGNDGRVFYNILKTGLFCRMSTTQININNKTPIFMVKFITFSVENQKLYSNLKDLKKFVILGSLENIYLFNIETLKEVFVIKKPNYIRENVVPDAQIGIGRAPKVVMRFAQKDEKDHLLLIVSWGKILYFYKLPINGKIIQEYKELGYYINLFNILRIGFMNNSTVYCLDKSFSIKVLDSSKINSGNVILNDDGQPDKPKNNSLAEIEKSRLVSANILNQNKLNLSDNIPREIYLYSIVDNDDSVVSVVVLGDKQLNNVKLIDWEFFLNYLQQKEDFLNLFSIGIELYKGKMMALSNIPDKKNKKKISDFLKQIVQQYVILNTSETKTGGFFLEETEDKEKMGYCIKMSIEFCIEIDAVEYLLKSIYPLFEAKDYSELFLAKLQPFILCDKIINTVLSSDIILNLIELYHKNGQLDILSQMLLHINIKSIDNIEVKNKLEELYLITPLIYLYMNGEKEDYFSPLEKMFNFFYTRAVPSSKLLINGEDIDYSNALTKKLLTLKEVRNCKEYNGHRILWYIRLCLTEKKFPDNKNQIDNMKKDNKMDANLFNALVPKITYWLLNPRVIDEFLRFDPKNYFMIFKNIFSIQKLYAKLVNSAKDSKLTIEVKTVLSTSDIKMDDIKPSSLINYLVNWCKKKDNIKIYFYLYDFIICILKEEDIDLGIDLKLESICYILKNYTKIIKDINNQEVKLTNSNLIKIFEKEKNFTEENYKKILYSIDDTIFNEVKLFIYDKIDYFDDCLKLYIDKKFNISNKASKLYKWIHDKLHAYQKGGSNYEKFIETLKEHCLPLAELSLNKFYELSKEIFRVFDKEIIDKLNDNSELLLNYIELVLKYIISTYENNENNVTSEEMDELKYTLGKHINLLCELNHHDKIVESIKSCPFYPLDECLKYCELAKAYQPCLFLYLKEGAIEKAFEMVNKRLDESFEKLIKIIDNENNDTDYRNTLDEVHKYLSDIKDICENNDLRLEDLWFKMLEKLYNYEERVKELLNKYEFSKEKYNNTNDLCETISKDIKELMEKMCSFVSIKRILEEVNKKNKNAGFKEFRDLLMEILNSYSNLSNILYSAKNLLTNLVLQNEHSFQVLNLKGELLTAQICSKCKKIFNKNLSSKEKIIVFSCNHVFHKECLNKNNSDDYGNEYSCPICIELEFNQYDNSGQSSLIKKNNSIITEKNSEKNDKFQVNISAPAKKTLKKLERYDNKALEKHILMINNSITVLNDQYREGYK